MRVVPASLSLGAVVGLAAYYAERPELTLGELLLAPLGWDESIGIPCAIAYATAPVLCATPRRPTEGGDALFTLCALVGLIVGTAWWCWAMTVVGGLALVGGA